MTSAKYTFASKKDLHVGSAKRGLYSTKKENGRVLIVGGSEYYHGAPALASTAAYSLLAALRVGVGYAVAYVPRSVLNPNRDLSPNVIVRPLSGKNLNLNDIPMLKKSSDRSDCLVIGSGLGRRKETLRAASRLISYANGNGKGTVIDADAVYAINMYKTRLGRSSVITPNDKEFSLLYKKELSATKLDERIKAAIAISKRLGCCVLLKGHNTIVTDGIRTKVVKSKSAALATMGTGDVLSGIVGAYMALDGEAFIAGVAGAFLHAAVGDALYKEKGNHILASDVVEYLPQALKKLGF